MLMLTVRNDLNDKLTSFDEPRYFYDDDKDVEIYHWLASTDALPLHSRVAMACTPWKALMAEPITIPLPTLISYTPKYDCEQLPLGKLYGVLMDFKYHGITKRPNADGVVFIIADQGCPPDINGQEWRLDKLWDWALDTKNCPTALRFRSLSYALKVMCGSEGSPFPCLNNRKDGYFSGTKSWKVEDWGLSLDQLISKDIPFFRYCSLPKDVEPQLVRKTRQKRKKLASKDPEEFMKGFDFKSVDLSSLSQTFILPQDDGCGGDRILPGGIQDKRRVRKLAKAVDLL